MHSPVTIDPVSTAFGGENEESTIVYGYMCKVDFQCELGCACGGNVVYPSLKDIKERRSCLPQCGIVKVAVVCTEIVDEGDWNAEIEE